MSNIYGPETPPNRIGGMTQFLFLYPDLREHSQVFMWSLVVLCSLANRIYVIELWGDLRWKFVNPAVATR
jgi:hypothetical protein